MLKEKIELYTKKNRDYAKGGDPLGNFNRVAAFFRNYPGLDLSRPETVAYVYMLKHIDAVLWSLCQGHTMKEGLKPRQGDVTVYSAILESIFY